MKKYIVLIYCVVCLSLYAKESVEDIRPNIILITPSRLGIDQLKQYGGIQNDTPNIDYLAKNGLTFYHFMARTNMVSSHRAIITGVSDAQTGSAARVIPIPAIEYYLPEELNKAGYDTCFVGKWRAGGWSSSGVTQFVAPERNYANPINLGFNHYWGIHSKQGAPGTAWGYMEEPNNPYYAVEKNAQPFYSSILPVGKDIYQPHNSIKYIENFIDYNQKQKNKKPFYIWWSMIYMYMHSTYWYEKTPDKALKGKNDDELYYANVRYMDKMIGRLLTKLKEHKITHNTIIIFASLSGTPSKRGNVKGVKGIYRGKVSYGVNYPHNRSEWGITYPQEVKEQNYRTPLIIYWPKHIKEARINTELFSIEDLLITTAKLAHAKGINKYVRKAETFKSYSMVPAIKGHINKGQKRLAIYMFIQPRLMPQTLVNPSYRFAQNREYKLYSTGEFYNIKEDPEEKIILEKLSPLEITIKKFLKYHIDINPTERPTWF